MAITPAHEAIAILIDLAEKGEIDPWDVQVIEVIDRFLTELGLMNESQDELEADLPQSGQAFLWASMLVLLKADSLEFLQTEDESEAMAELIEGEILGDLEPKTSLPLHLELHLKRRTSVPPIYKRRVTLTELITQLEHIATELEEATSSKSSSQRSRRSRRETIRAITQLAHNENLTELAAQLEKFLYLELPQLAPGQENIDWEELLQCWQTASSNLYKENSADNEHHNPSSERAGIFWALLLLSAQSKVELSQQEFYQDLSVRPLNSASKFSRLGA
jgi:segregation and condensation protein A